MNLRTQAWTVVRRMAVWTAGCAAGLLLVMGAASPAQADPTLQEYFTTLCKDQPGSFHEGAKLTVYYVLPAPIQQEKLGKGSIVTLSDTTLVIHADISRGPSPGKFDMTLQEAGDGKFQIDLLMDHPKKLKYSGVYPLEKGKRGALVFTGPDWSVAFKCYGGTSKDSGLEANFHVDKAIPADYLLHFDF